MFTDATPTDILSEQAAFREANEPVPPFFLAGGNPAWTPREPVLMVTTSQAPNPVGRPRLQDLTGISVVLPNGMTCTAVEKLNHGRWRCLTDNTNKVFTGSFLRELKQSQGR